MMVKPDVITLSVSTKSEEDEDVSYFNSDDEDEADERKAKEKEEKAKREYSERMNKVEAVFKKYNVAFKYHDKKKDKSLFSKESLMYENAYEVTITDEAVLTKVQQELAAIPEVNSKVADMKLSNKDKYELLLIERVMKKAEAEAMAIAKAMGVTLDKPLNVSNQSIDNMYSSMFNNPESMGGMGALFSMMGSMFKGGSEENKQVAVSKSLVVRYGIK